MFRRIALFIIRKQGIDFKFAKGPRLCMMNKEIRDAGLDPKRFEKITFKHDRISGFITLGKVIGINNRLGARGIRRVMRHELNHYILRHCWYSFVNLFPSSKTLQRIEKEASI